MSGFLSSYHGLGPTRFNLDSLSPVPSHEDRVLVSKFQTWFQDLSLVDREDAMLVTNKQMVRLICQMHGKKLREGEGSFSLLESSSAETGALDDSVFFHRSGSALRTEEWEFERELRVFDAQSYMDSLTTTRNLTQGTLRFLELAGGVSEGKAFQTPCKAVFREGNEWEWDLPAWFNFSYFSLSQFALALLEQALWKQFWKQAKINPGKTPGLTLIPIQTGSSGATGIQKQLILYWKTLKKSMRSRVLGDVKTLFRSVKEGIMSKQMPNSLQYQQGKLLSVCFPMAFAPHGHYSGLYEERNKYEQEESVDSLTKMSTSATSEKFFSVLFYSPLHRTDTPFDQVCRQLIIKVRTAYTLHEATSTLRKLQQKETKYSDDSSSDSSLFIQDPVFHQEAISDDDFEE